MYEQNKNHQKLKGRDQRCSQLPQGHGLSLVLQLRRASSQHHNVPSGEGLLPAHQSHSLLLVPGCNSPFQHCSMGIKSVGFFLFFSFLSCFLQQGSGTLCFCF